MQHFLSRTLLGTHHSKGKERTVFLTSDEEKLIYSIFFVVLYWARIMLGVIKECTVFLTSGEEKFSYSIFFLVLYWARIMLGVKSVQFSLHQGRKSLVTAFSFSYSIGHASC